MRGRIINRNSIEVLKELKDGSIDLIVTDPPYRTTPRGNSGTTGGMLKNKLSMKGKIFEHNDIKPIEYIPDFYRVLKEDAHCYIMTNHVNLQEILNTATGCGFKFVKSLIWNKGNKIMGRYYMSQFEYILFFRKGKDKKINFCGTADIINVPNKKLKGDDGKNLHDTEKPVELMRILIKNSTLENEVVFDPFCGIGSVAIASELLNRKYLCVELDEKYYNETLKRLEEFKKDGEVDEISASN